MCDYFITVVEGVGFWESVFLTQALHQTGEISVVCLYFSDTTTWNAKQFNSYLWLQLTSYHTEMSPPTKTLHGVVT